MALDAYVFIGYPINEHEKVIMKKLLIAALLTQSLIVGVNAADHPLETNDDLAFLMALEESLRDVSSVLNSNGNEDELEAAIALSLQGTGNSSQITTVTSVSSSTSRFIAGINSINVDVELGYQPTGNELIESSDTEQFQNISAKLRDIYYGNSDVHAGDRYISHTIPRLLDIAAKILITHDDLGVYDGRVLSETKVNLISLVKLYSPELVDYNYEGQPFSQENILDIIKRQCDRSVNEVNGYASGTGGKVWSYALALALNLLSDERISVATKKQIVHHLVDQSIEGMLTQGGCIQGFVNRGFIALMNMVAYYVPR